VRGSIRVADAGIDSDGSGDGQYAIDRESTAQRRPIRCQLDRARFRATQAPLVVNNLPVICAELVLQQGFHALVGRDILAQCLLEYNGATGLFTLAY
jgi:hypothetical protein